jgi:hypothetical protein
MTLPPLFSKKDIAEMLEISVNRVKLLITKGEIQPTMINSGHSKTTNRGFKVFRYTKEQIELIEALHQTIQMRK